MPRMTESEGIDNELGIFIGALLAAIAGVSAWLLWDSTSGFQSFLAFVAAGAFGVSVKCVFYRIRVGVERPAATGTDAAGAVRERISPGVRWRTVAVLMLLAAFVGNRGTSLIPASAKAAIINFLK